MDKQLSNETIAIPIGSPVTDEQLEKAKVNYIQSTKIKLGYSFIPEMGIGVFATETIEPGELIERCPMVQLAFRSKYQHDPQIKRYLYSNKNCGCRDCVVHGSHMSMVLGYGMIYNHQNDPNTEWRFAWDRDFADVICVKKIEAGEEVFVSYGSSYFSNRPYYDKDGKAIEQKTNQQESNSQVIEN